MKKTLRSVMMTILVVNGLFALAGMFDLVQLSTSVRTVMLTVNALLLVGFILTGPKRQAH